MKKISLKNVKETLTRKEMRSITGGYGFCGCASYTCARYFGKHARCGGGGCCTYQGSSGSW
jgi:natural product precursor